MLESGIIAERVQARTYSIASARVRLKANWCCAADTAKSSPSSKKATCNYITVTAQSRSLRFINDFVFKKKHQEDYKVFGLGVW